MLGSEGEVEEDFDWKVDTGNIGYDSPDKKYLSRFNLRMNISQGTVVRAYIQYDSDGIWESKGTVKGNTLGTFTLPIARNAATTARYGLREAEILNFIRLLKY